MAGFAEEVYSKMPVCVQNVACTLAGINMRRTRFNKTFRDALDFLEKSQWWSLAEQCEYRDDQLRKIIRHAYDTVPYYREIFDSRKLTSADIQTVADLQKLPILEKETVRQRYSDLLSRGWPKRRIKYIYTGGTTGKALKVATDIDTQPWHWATYWRHRGRFGLKVGMPFIVFAGRSVVPLSKMHPPFWRRNLTMNQTYVSIHHMTKQNMPALVEYLQKRCVAYYSGYPSGLYLLATYLLDNDIHLKHPPRITGVGAETLLPHQRRVIERGLDTEVVDHYAATEQCVFISECDKHSYHFDMEFGAIELLPLEGVQSNVRRIICTGFRNPAMPLIRYNIDDLATISEDTAPCPCGRAATKVEKIDGRIESYVVTPDGRQLGRLDFLFKQTDQIQEVRLVQDTLEHLTVEVVRRDAYSAEDEARLIKNLRVYLGNMIGIDIDYLKEIPREANGKFRQIVSKVFHDRYALCDETGKKERN